MVQKLAPFTRTKIMHQPKWFRTEYNLKEGDVVLFLKQDSLLSKTYQYGMVISVQQSRDNVIPKVKVKYQNENESVDRETFQSVPQLVMIHPVDEIDIIQELNNIKNWYNLVAPLLSPL